MPSDAEITILVKLVDQMSGQLTKIEANISGMSANSQKAAESLGSSFESTTTKLLAVGNVASSVDSIFSSYQNMELRVENATERVTGAHEVLQDAQTKLNRLMQSGTATSQDLADAHEQVERAQRHVIISENNLARTNNMIIGTYIQMGVSVVRVVASMPALIGSIETTTVSIVGLEIAAAPLLLVLGAIVAVAGLAYFAYQHHAEATKNLAENTQELARVQEEITGVQKNLNDATFGYADAIDKVYDNLNKLAGKQSPQEAQLKAEIAQTKEQIAEKERLLTISRTGGAGAPAGTHEALTALKTKLTAQQADLAVIDSKREMYKAELNLAKTNAEQQAGLLKDNVDFTVATHEQIKSYIATNFTPAVETERKKLIDNEKTRLDDLKKKWQELIEKQREYMSRAGAVSGAGGAGGGPATSTRFGARFSSRKDFLMRPGHEAVEFSPDDTIMGFKGNKGMGGINITIGNVYGMNPGDISRALAKELSKKMSI